MHFGTKSAYWLTSSALHGLNPSSPCAPLTELHHTAASVPHMLTAMCDVLTLTPTAARCKMTFAAVKVRDGRGWQASGLFLSSQTCCENDDRWHVERAPSAVKLAQRAPPADSLCDSFSILTSYGAHACVYKREETDKYMSVCTFVLTYSMGISCKHSDYFYTEACILL